MRTVPHYLSAPSRPDPATADRALERLDRVAGLLDSRWSVLGLRFGADALMNLIPGLGPLSSKAISAWIIWEARRLGVPPATLLRMAGLVGLDALIGAVPVLGWAADAILRANKRNVAVLRNHLRGLGAAQSGANGRLPHGAVALRI
jgi:hypothetical protein